ncbi:MAG: type II secretion system F family protein [Candidatus Moranbacteria bacterium]|nr:type II secretion system F family protein [Candidatus Moranbacteria bacterium]NTW46463.1 type II secretion system F family protein [Candidatus Moranbacteria bacterium]
MKFAFKAKNAEGIIREGVVDAESRDAASLLLQRNGLLPISLRDESGRSLVTKDLARIWEGVSRKELVAFFRQLGVLIEAKVPVTASLMAIAEETENSYFRIILKEVKDDVDDGASLSDAFAKHADVFSPLTVNLIHAGEVSGGLQHSILFVADTLERDYYLVSKIKGALYYPAFVLGVSAIIGFLVITFIIPKITVILKDFNQSLPWYTKAIIATSDFLSAYWWTVVAGVVVVVASFVYYIRTPDGKKTWDEQIFSIPIVGRIAQYVYVARLSENLGVLLNGGIPIIRSLSIVSNIVGNMAFQAVIADATEEVRKGGNMSTAFFRSKQIPHLVSQMVRIGEESGTISVILKSVSGFYSQEVDGMTNNLTALLEPVLIVVLGIGVAILVVGILLPIYNVVGSYA